MISDVQAETVANDDADDLFFDTGGAFRF